MEKLIINKSCQYLVDTYMKEMQYYKKLILSTYKQLPNYAEQTAADEESSTQKNL